MEADLTNATAAEILTELGVPAWDLVIFGDGSGTGWKMGAGWAGIVMDRLMSEPFIVSGAWNTGTISVAELMPYLHGVMWYEATYGSELRKRNRRVLSVHCISDSQLIVNQGNGVARAKANTLSPWWAAFQEVLRVGYAARFHHLKRDTTMFNKLADHVSRRSREHLAELDVIAEIRASSPEFSLANLTGTK